MSNSTVQPRRLLSSRLLWTRKLKPLSLLGSIGLGLYEFIAYFGSASIFSVLAILGFVKFSTVDHVLHIARTLNSYQLTIALLIASVLAYSYGQVASAFSGPAVAGPVSKLARLAKRHASPDFFLSFDSAVRAYGLQGELPDGKVIMKRYAREKLARVNTLNAAILLAASVIAYARRLLPGATYPPGLHKPSLWFVAFVALLVPVFAYEYYKRHCWNNDLLLKVLPAVVSNASDTSG